MRRDFQEDAALVTCFEYQSQRALFEIADAAVNEPGGMRRSTGAEVRFLNERNAKSSQCRVARDPRAGDAAADYEHIHRCCRHGCERVGACHQLPSTSARW